MPASPSAQGNASNRSSSAVCGTAATRRRVTIGGRRITVVDIHAHTFVPEVWEVIKDTALAATAADRRVPVCVEAAIPQMPL